MPRTCNALIAVLQPALIALAAMLAAGEEAAFDPAASPARVERVLAGWTAPLRTMDLSAEVSARVIRVETDAGQMLPAGPVVRLDPELADLAVRQAEAALAASRGSAAQAEPAVAAADAAAQAAQAELRRAERDAAQAARDRDRAAQLVADGRTSVQAREAADLAAEAADLARQAASARAASAAAQVATARAALAAAGAQVAVAEAALAAARATRARHDVPGPEGFVVLERLAEPGSLAAPGTPLLRLADTRTLVIPLRVDESELAALRAQAERDGLRVSFAGGATAAARIRRVDAAFDPVSRKRLVELAVAGAEAPEASGGLAASLRIAVPDPSGARRIPAAYVAWRLEQPWVKLAEGGDRSVAILRRDGGDLIVPAEALPAGARLLPIAAAAGR